MLFGFETDYGLAVTVIGLVFALIAFVVTFIRTGSLKKSLKESNEMLKKVCQPIQTFPNVKDEYRLNTKTNELEKTGGVIDIKAEINSYLDTQLDRILDKLLPVDEKQEELYATVSQYQTDLDELMFAEQVAEKYRDKFGFDDNGNVLSNDVLIEKIKNENAVLSQRLEKVKSKKQVKKEIKEEILNEKS